ncbi:MAG: CerR family C-terminal domain-containing protein [Opitutales bacterium]|nr:CerR family C-terminal domain-containing protein [Opitutales bacterium]
MKYNFIQHFLDGAELDTPSKILAAALVEFGNAPVKNVGTRDIAKRAGVNIAAISYYFKGKDELYAILIDAIIEHISKLTEPFHKRFEALMENPSESEARALLNDYISWRLLGVDEDKKHVFKNILSIIFREEFNNTELFKQFHSRIFGKTDELLRESIKMILKDKVDDETARIMSTAILGSLIRFGAVPNSVMLSMNWHEISSVEIEKIRNVIFSMLDKVLK